MNTGNRQRWARVFVLPLLLALAYLQLVANPAVKELKGLNAELDMLKGDAASVQEADARCRVLDRQIRETAATIAERRDACRQGAEVLETVQAILPGRKPEATALADLVELLRRHRLVVTATAPVHQAHIRQQQEEDIPEWDLEPEEVMQRARRRNQEPKPRRWTVEVVGRYLDMLHALDEIGELAETPMVVESLAMAPPSETEWSAKAWTLVIWL